MVAVAITASNRAVAVQRWLPPPGPLAKAAARQRSSVATLTPTSRETRSTAELSGGNNRATIRSLYACPYLANFPKPKPPGSRSYPGGNFSDTGGAVGESLGMDRLLKSNTSKTRTHSLFRRGCMLYELIPNMPEHRLSPLIAAFAKAVSQTNAFSGLFAWRNEGMSETARASCFDKQQSPCPLCYTGIGLKSGETENSASVMQRTSSTVMPGRASRNTRPAPSTPNTAFSVT